jgi:hypothetical protein
MSRQVALTIGLLFASGLSGVAACLSDSSSTNVPDGGGDGASPSSSSSGSGSSGGEAGGHGDGGISDAKAESGGLGLLVDNMTAMMGTGITLQVPDGDIPGSYYTYSDYPVVTSTGMMSSIISGRQLVDTPVNPAITNADGSQIVGEICFGGGANGSEAGTVVNYAGLGMSLVYGAPTDPNSDAMCPPPGLSPPVPFDASRFSGVSFYIWVDPSVGTSPPIRFTIPDTQTADFCSIPTVACALPDATGGGDSAATRCYDDFGATVTFTAGTWTKVSFQWSDLSQIGFGAMFSALRTDQLVGMKWQVNGSGPDAAAEPFRFCISDIYFTP